MGGDFLSLNPPPGVPGLEHYSAKYAQMMRDVQDILKNSVGKIMIYHNRVRLSGVFLIQEVLRANGIISLDDAAQANTICNKCGLPHSQKKYDHALISSTVCSSTQRS